MAIVVMLTDGGQLITDAEVAAFVDGECRCAAFADEGLYYLLVPGEGSGQKIELKANIGGIVQTVCTLLTYASDASIGTPWEPLVIDISDPTSVHEIDISHSTLDNQSDWYNLQGMNLGTTKPTARGIYLNEHRPAAKDTYIPKKKKVIVK